MCLPSFDLILRHIKRVIRRDKNIKSVFVASDNTYMIDELNNALARMEVRSIFYLYHFCYITLNSSRKLKK